MPDDLRAVAGLARRALEAPDAVAVMRDAVALLVAAVPAEHVTVLELDPGDERLRLRAGVGWGDGVVGTTVEPLAGGQIAFTLRSSEPVASPDLAAETRFVPSPMLLEAGVRSSMSVRIPSGGDRAYGVIGAHTLTPRAFPAPLLALGESVAAIVGAAIANQRRALEVNDGVLQSLVLAGYALERGDVTAATVAVARARQGARTLVDELLGEGHTTLPGDLRRGGAAG